MRRILPLRADRPLRHAADDLLGFERIAEGLAEQVLATRDCGLLAGVSARHEGAGRSSFLNLLHSSLLARGCAVLRLQGPCDASIAREACRLGGAPLVLVDDADESVADWDAGAVVIAAFRVHDAAQAARRVAPCLQLPAWSDRATALLARRLAGDAAGHDVAERAWRQMLARAVTPREAFRIAQAAGAVLAASGASEQEVAEALGGHAPRALVDLAACYFAPLASEAAEVPGARPRIADHASESASPDEDAPDVEAEPARARCAELAAQADAAAADELGELLRDERVTVRLAAIAAFAHLPPALGIPPLRPLLAHPDASSRRAAAHVLGRLGDQASFEEIAALVADPSAEVRRAATAALGRLGGARAVTALLAALDAAPAGLRMAAETALAQALDDAGTEGCGADVTAHGGGTRHADSVRDVLSSLACVVASRHEALRPRALAALERLGLGSAAAALAALLASPDAREADAAATALAQAPGALSALEPLALDPDETLARRACDLLGRLGDRAAVPLLLQAHERGADGVRQAAAASLVRLGYGA